MTFEEPSNERVDHHGRMVTSIHRMLFLSLVCFSSGCASDSPGTPDDSSSTTVGPGSSTGAATGGQATTTGAGGATTGTGGMGGSATGGASTSTSTTAGVGAVGGAGTGGSAGEATASASTGSAQPCTHECLAECAGGGTVQPGICEGAQVCCQGPTVPDDDPLAHLKPSAERVGLLLANRFAQQPLEFESVADLPPDGYKIACEWYGALGVASLTDSGELLDALVSKFDPLKTDFLQAMLDGEAHVDRYIFGMVPLEIYLRTDTESYLLLGTETADAQQASDQTRGAIDDMFMMTSLQLEAYRATGDVKYIDFMADTMLDYLGEQRDNGLFFHNVDDAPVYWGRGNGWFAAGMAEIMRDLSPDSERYQSIEAGYVRMMEGLLQVQSDNGLWYQVLDRQGDANNWEESSGSAMFTYAMVAGVKRGILDRGTYVPVIEAAWAGLQGKISTQGDVSEICVGTWYKATAEEYMALDRLVGDGHGQAPVLWAAAELLR